MLAYSSISQGGFILMPLAVAGTGETTTRRCGRRRLPLDLRAMNLGAFAVVIAVGRKTRSGEISATADCSPMRRVSRR